MVVHSPFFLFVIFCFAIPPFLLVIVTNNLNLVLKIFFLSNAVI